MFYTAFTLRLRNSVLYIELIFQHALDMAKRFFAHVSESQKFRRRSCHDVGNRVAIIRFQAIVSFGAEDVNSRFV